MNQAMQVLTSHKSVEWYTPSWLVWMARRVLGDIDLDPASCAEANETIRARRFYTKEQDGLTQPWAGRVFLNPPYSTNGGKSSQAIWSAKLAHEYDLGHVEAAILIVKAALGYRWFEQLLDNRPVCLLRERVEFIREDGFVGQDKRATAVVYFGTFVPLFVKIFSSQGHIIGGN